MGADCILLIMAALTDEQARELEELARALDMDVLAEVHDRRELDRALGLQTPADRHQQPQSQDACGPTLRPPSELAPLVPPDRFLIAESGIRTPCGPAAGCAAAGAQLLPGRREPDAPARRRARRTRALLTVRHELSGFTHFDARGPRGDGGCRRPSRRPSATATARGTRGDAAGDAGADPDAAARRRATCSASRGWPASWRPSGPADLIPLCHPLPIAAVTRRPQRGRRAAVEIEATVRTTGPDRGRDGGADRASRGGADGLRHVQGGRSRHADRGLRVVHKAGGKSGEFRQA